MTSGCRRSRRCRRWGDEGDPNPSRDEQEVTQEIQRAAGLLGVVVHDHVIVGNGRCFSFRGEGLLEG